MRNIRTGKGASLAIGGNTLPGANIVPITSIKSNVNIEYAKATDSGSYVASSDTLYSIQEPGETAMKATIEGNFDLNQTSSAIFALITGGALVAATIYDATGSIFASGMWNISNGSTTLTVPGASMYSFSCDLMSYGVYTLGGS